jgi:hypothetical protein
VWLSNAVTTTSVTPSNLQSSTLYFVRLWTEKSNTWYYADSSFTTGSGSAHLTYPTNGATNIDPYAAFTWTTIQNAQSYSLWVGTSPGTSNVYSSGPLTTSSQVIPGLLQNTTYFVRLFTQTSQGTSSADASFTTGLGLAHLTAPAANAPAVDPFQPFRWNSVPGAQFYYLWVGTTPGASDVYSTGSVPSSVTSTVVSGLLGGLTYYARMWTFINNGWSAVSTTFSTAPQPLPSDANSFRNTVQQQTGAVRLMTQGTGNTPIPGTRLAQQVAAAGHTQALCTDFARTLVPMLLGQRISTRLRDVVFDGANLETHEMTEYYDPFLGQWIDTDPTFGLTYWNPSTNSGLSVSQISTDVQAQNFSAVPTTFVTNNGSVYLTNYYMDPILLYLNVLPTGQNTTQGPVANSPLPYMTRLGSSSIGQPSHYVFSFANQSDAVTISDPIQGTLTLRPSNGTPFSSDTRLNSGWSITSTPAGLVIYVINRYKF